MRLFLWFLNIVSSLRSRLDRPSRVAVIFFCLVGKILMVLLLLCWQLKSPGSLLAFVFFFHLCHFSSLASTWSWPWNKMCELFVLQCCLTVFFSNQFSSGRQEDFFRGRQSDACCFSFTSWRQPRFIDYIPMTSQWDKSHLKVASPKFT